MSRKTDNRMIFFTAILFIALLISLAFDSYGQGTALVRSCAGTGLTVKQAKLEVTKDGDINIIPCDARSVLLRGNVLEGSGTVQSVALSLPNIFTVTGSPITSSGTLTATLASQSQNLIFGSPNGSSGAPSFRALVAGDIPSLDAAKITTGTFSTSAIPSLAASKITSGTFDTARLGSGTADNTTYLRGDGTWATISSAVLPWEGGFTGSTTVSNSYGIVETSYTSTSYIITIPSMSIGQSYTILAGGASAAKIRIQTPGGVANLFKSDGSQYGTLSATNTIVCGGSWTLIRGGHGYYINAPDAYCTVTL